MKNTESRILAVAHRIHSEIEESPAFTGYEGDKEAFDRLYTELLVIAKTEVPDGAVDFEDQLENTYYDFVDEIFAGDRAEDWYLNFVSVT